MCLEFSIDIRNLKRMLEASERCLAAGLAIR
jgi:hypothetical protein